MPIWKTFKVGELLVNHKIINGDQLETALKEQNGTRTKKLGEILVEFGFCSYDDIAQAMAKQMSLPYIDVDLYKTPKNALVGMEEKLLRENIVVPFDKIGQLLLLAMSGPIDRKLITRLEDEYNVTVCPFVSTLPRVQKKISEVLLRRDTVSPERFYEKENNQTPSATWGKSSTMLNGSYEGKVLKLMVKHGVVTQMELNSRVAELKSDHDEPGIELLIDTGLISEDDVLFTLFRESGLAPVRLSSIDSSLLDISAMEEKVARHYSVLPLSRIGNVLTFATHDPFDIRKFDEVGKATNCELRPVVALLRDILAGIDNLYKISDAQQSDEHVKKIADLNEIMPDTTDDFNIDKQVSLAADSTEVVKLVNSILAQAIRVGASDIHIEPSEQVSTVRIRVDGILYEKARMPGRLHNFVISRIKILSGLNIAERRVPQDGKFKLKFEGRHVDLRVSTLPIIYGEKAVLRILDQGTPIPKIDRLGLESKCLADFRAALRAPGGMVLVTGPTGSGKSTLLYSALLEMKSTAENIATVEDPVEYQIKGVNQVMVNTKSGLTFAVALRSILRQDPDIIMVGEIRDFETADIAIKSAMTGHLVLSTLHTNDAASSITRLVDMGIPAYLVASSLSLVSAQRLLRRLCLKCREPIEKLPAADILIAHGFREAELNGLVLYKPVGCRDCFGGYRGRFAVLETLPMEKPVRRMIIRGDGDDAIKQYAIQKAGMVTSHRAALQSVMKGVTSLDEAINLTLPD